jgi:hypothetical protein
LRELFSTVAHFGAEAASTLQLIRPSSPPSANTTPGFGRLPRPSLSADPDGNEPPVLAALLCGPTAFGPRLGTSWQAIGRRLRPATDSYPSRIVVERVDRVDRLEITLLTSRERANQHGENADRRAAIVLR